MRNNTHSPAGAPRLSAAPRPARVDWPGYDTRPGRLSEADVNEFLADKADERARIIAALEASPVEPWALAHMGDEPNDSQWHDGAPVAAEAATEVGANQAGSVEIEASKTLGAILIVILLLVFAGSWAAGWRPDFTGVLPWR